MATVMRWLGKPENAAFREQYACARDAQADKLVEEMLEIADEECTMVRSDKHGSKDDDGQGNTEVVFDATAVARNKLRVDARKWVASKMAPKKYGDKVTQEVVGAGGGPVETVTRIELVPLK
ncbi:terminase small subunit protein [Delftia acidovorans]|nr:terminase small subunit protein [Delftia acidovorans]QPS76049.1 terminase small subunit protein [Delftia acidovorans]